MPLGIHACMVLKFSRKVIIGERGWKFRLRVRRGHLALIVMDLEFLHTSYTVLGCFVPTKLLNKPSK